MVDNGDWGPEGLDDLEQELESLSSISSDDTTETLNSLENEKELEEYGVWVKVGPETIHDSQDIDLTDSADSELENLEENVMDEMAGDKAGTEPLDELEDETLAEIPDDWGVEVTTDEAEEESGTLSEPLNDLEESLSEDIDWNKRSESEEEEMALPVDISDAGDNESDELNNMDDSFEEIDLGDISDEHEFGSFGESTTDAATRSHKKEVVDLPEITSSGVLGGEQLSAAAASGKTESAVGTNILEQIEKELAAIKNELAGLKKELSLIREGGHESSDVEVKPVNQENGKGFFDEDDDEVVALTGDELDNILETADIMEAEAGEVESSPEDIPAVTTDSSEDLSVDLDNAADELVDFAEESGQDELTVQLEDHDEELSLDSLTESGGTSLSNETEEDVLSLELSDIDTEKTISEAEMLASDVADESPAYEEITLAQPGDEQMPQPEAGTGSDTDEATELAELDEVAVEAEEEITLDSHREPEPEEVALVLPEEESEEDEEIALEFPEDLEDGISEEITEEFVIDDAQELPEQEIALGSVGAVEADEKPADESTDFELEESAQEIEESAQEINELEDELELPADEKLDFTPAAEADAEVDDLLELGDEELTPESGEPAGEEQAELEDLGAEWDTGEEDETGVVALESSEEDSPFAGDSLGEINLDFPEEEKAETEEPVNKSDADEELDLGDSQALLLDEPEDLTLEVSEEDQDASEPEEISLALPDELEVEEDIADTLLAEETETVTDNETAEDLALELVDELPAEQAAAEVDEITFEPADEEAAADLAEEVQDITLDLPEEGLEEELEEITLELPEEKTEEAEIEEIELEPIEPDLHAEDEPAGSVSPLSASPDKASQFSPEAGKPVAAAGKTSKKQELDKLPGDLKDEIKTVLTYMDQLLESLPEEKIEEFAKSEYFEVYKKLFEDLGIVN